MHAAATLNVREGLLTNQDASDAVQNEGITVSAINTGDNRVVTERIAGQIVTQYAEPTAAKTTPAAGLNQGAITIGEALEASALAVGDKPVDQSDAAAIQAAEVRAIGSNEIMPDGIGAAAQSAANRNPRTRVYEDKTTIADVLGDATFKLPADKVVRGADAEGVIGAELRNKPDMRRTPGGVASSIAAAAKLNQKK